MIANEREYRVTKAEIKRFEEALAHVDDRAAERHPRLQRAMREGMESQLAELRAQIAEYEALRDGNVRVLDVSGLERLPDVFISARIAAGLTQAQLAERMGLKQQQVQQYEQTRFAKASLTRLLQFREALGVEVDLHALLQTEDTIGAAHTRAPASVS